MIFHIIFTLKSQKQNDELLPIIFCYYTINSRFCGISIVFSLEAESVPQTQLE